MLKFRVREVETDHCKYTNTTMIKVKSPVDNNSSVNVDLEFTLTPQQKEQLIKSLLRTSYD